MRWPCVRQKKTAPDILFEYETVDGILASSTPLSVLPSSSFRIDEETRYRVVSVLGAYGKGKTFLLNALFHLRLPVGLRGAMSGLHGCWLPKEQLLVIDSPGLERPVASDADESVAVRTDAFTSDLLLEVSDFLLVVVQDVFRTEQELVKRLARRLGDREAHGHVHSTELFVAVNMRNVSDLRAARETFQDQVVNRFPGVRPPDALQHKSGTDLLHVCAVGSLSIRFVGFAKNGSSAAKRINNEGFRQLRQWFDAVNPAYTEGRVFSTHLQDAVQTALVRVGLAFGVPSGGHQIAVDYISETQSLAVTVPQPGRPPVAVDGRYLPESYVYDVPAVDGIVGPFRVIEVWCASVSMDEVVIRDIPNGVRVEIDRKPPGEESRTPVPSYAMPMGHGRWGRDFVFDPRDGRFSLDGGAGMATLLHGVLRICLLKDANERKVQIAGRTRGSTVRQPQQHKSPVKMLGAIGKNPADAVLSREEMKRLILEPTLGT
jgi:hypothetical protein